VALKAASHPEIGAIVASAEVDHLLATVLHRKALVAADTVATVKVMEA